MVIYNFGHTTLFPTLYMYMHLSSCNSHTRKSFVSSVFFLPTYPNMEIKTKALLIPSLLLLLANCMQHCVNGQQQKVPCFFVFGDSLSDNGNNNNLRTAAKCNYNPYGVDFQEGPSGRFTNGKNLVDFLGNILNLIYFFLL